MYGTCAKTRFRLSPKRTSPFKSARASVQSTAGSRGVRISGSNAGYTTFRGSLKSFPYTSPPVRHRVPSGFKRTVTQRWLNIPRDVDLGEGLISALSSLIGCFSEQDRPFGLANEPAFCLLREKNVSYKIETWNS